MYKSLSKQPVEWYYVVTENIRYYSTVEHGCVVLIDVLNEFGEQSTWYEVRYGI